MNLLIDAGNTRVKWGLHDGAVWHARGAVPTATPEALEAALAVQPVPARVMGANVAGASVALAVGRLCAAWKRTPGWLVPGIEAGGVRNAYLDPTQLGPDRWAALIGARTLHTGAALVVTAGTATTVDVLTAEGVFRGGIILPGLELMRRALARDTARLPFADGRFDATPRRTADAIVVQTEEATRAVRLAISDDCGFTYSQIPLQRGTDGTYRYSRPVAKNAILFAETESTEGAISTSLPTWPLTCKLRVRQFGPRPPATPL